MSSETYLTKDQIEKFIEEMRRYDNIKLEEIPEYRLYISQIEEFFDKKLGKGIGEDEDKKTISKTMIQNYIKDGLIMPPEGKSYNRNHVILLTIIYNLKSILAIKDIKKLLSPIVKILNDENNTTKIENIYNSYYKLKEIDFKRYPDILMREMEVIKKCLDEYDISGEEWSRIPYLLLILTLIAQSNIRKQLAERMIELYFSDEDNQSEGS